MEPEKPAAQLTIIAVGTEPESGRSDEPHDESHTVAPNLSSTDSTLQAALYQVVATRRLGYDTLIWQVPALGLTAQAFLFTTALTSPINNPARLIAAALALVIALISMQLMSKHRYHEEIDARLLEKLEKNLKLADVLGCPPHAKPTIRAATLGARTIKSNFIIRRSSYRLWMCGLGLFAFAALGIIVTSLVNVVPLWAEIVTLSR
ncbi:MAG: hypothetical protein ABI068_09870 [Ktedonobacterales bacterium]